jgi:hypothetical protein
LNATIARARQVRLPELPLWIACLSEGLMSARRLSRGEPLDTASKDVRRLRWQLTWDVADLREWVSASDEGGLLWIASVLDASLGAGAFDLVAYDRQVRLLLVAADAHVDRLEAEVIRRAVERTEAVPGDALPWQDQGAPRVLRGARGPAAKAVAARPRSTERRRMVGVALGEDQAPDPASRRLRLSVR